MEMERRERREERGERREREMGVAGYVVLLWLLT
jgi:hypothetical protein